MDSPESAESVGPGRSDDLFESAPCGYAIFDEDGIILRVNKMLLTMVDAEPTDVIGRRFPKLLSVGGQLFFEMRLQSLLRLQGFVHEVALDLKRGDTRVPVLMSIAEAAGDGTGPREFLATIADITERRRYEDELREARRLADAQRRRVVALQTVSAELSKAVTRSDVAAVIESTAAAGLGADAITLWRLDADDTELRPVSSPVREDGDDWFVPFDREAKRPHWQALDTMSVVTVTRGDGASDFPGIEAAMLSLGHELVRFIPFRSGKRLAGVVSMGFGEANQIEAEDEELLVEVVRQAAAALERAELYEQQRDIVLMWQENLMSTTLPTDDRVRLRSHYAPATQVFRAGGDWFDAELVDDDRLWFIVGDVVGHGVAAAAAMGKLRSAARALTHAGFGPTELLERLDRFVERTPGTFASTAICGDLDLVTGVARIARAGHPPPLLVAEDSSTYLEAQGGPPLGVSRISRPDPMEFELSPTERLVLFTDGLIERRNEILDVGLDRLQSLLSGTDNRSLRDLVRASATRDHLDDICVLVVART